MPERKYTFKAKVWMYPGKAAWYFVTVPQNIAKDIDFYFAHHKKALGSIKVDVTIGNTNWNTSLFPDKNAKSYLLPIKAEVRKKEKIKDGSAILSVIQIHE